MKIEHLFVLGFAAAITTFVVVVVAPAIQAIENMNVIFP